MAAWTIDQAYDFGVLETQLPAWSASHPDPIEQSNYFAQLVAQGHDLHTYADSLWLSNKPLSQALFDAEIAGLYGGIRPSSGPTPPSPTPTPTPTPEPEKELCKIAQGNLQIATDRYLANKTKFDQTSQGKSVQDLQTQHDTVNRLSAELDDLNTASTAQLAKDLAFVTGDTLKWLFGGYVPAVATALYNGFAIGRDSAILVSDVQKANGEGLAIDMSTVVDGVQLIASVIGATLVREETEYVGAAIDIYNVLIDGSQIPGHLTELTGKADIVAKNLRAAQDKLDDILFFQNNRAQWEKSLSDEYDAVNQKVANVYGKCVTQVTVPNAQPANTMSQPATAQVSLGVVELKDPRVGTVVFGTASSDSIVKTTGDNGVYAGDGNDVITLAGNTNAVFGGLGNDTITLGPGTTEIAAFSGKFSDYKMAFIQGALVVTDAIANRDGVDTIKGATNLQFLDGAYKLDFAVPDITRAITKLDGVNVVAASDSVVIDPTKLLVLPSI